MVSLQVVRKKTPFQKHREEEEAKKKRAEEEAASLYEEFVESFKGDETGAKTFVRGGTINPDAKSSADGPKTKPGSRYVPSFLPPGLAALGSGNKVKEPDKKRVLLYSSFRALCLISRFVMGIGVPS
eukprot:SM000241S08522  [mRNA]  locus=s241:176169:177015:- [translate_table: standard]